MLATYQHGSGFLTQILKTSCCRVFNSPCSQGYTQDCKSAVDIWSSSFSLTYLYFVSKACWQVFFLNMGEARKMAITLLPVPKHNISMEIFSSKAFWTLVRIKILADLLPPTPCLIQWLLGTCSIPAI